MNGRGKAKGIVLLGPGKAKPLGTSEQPLGAARDLVRAGNAERKALRAAQGGVDDAVRHGAEAARGRRRRADAGSGADAGPRF